MRDETGSTALVVDWTVVMLRLVSRWLRKSWIWVGDGAYACIELGHHCRKHGVALISRLRRGVNLYEFPETPRLGNREVAFKESRAHMGIETQRQ